MRRFLRAALPVLAILVGARSSFAQTDDVRPAPWSEATLDLAARVPVQEGGRIKPLHTYAGFTLLRLNGKRSTKTPGGERLDPVGWLLDTLFYPEAAATYEVLLVQNAEVIEAIGVDLDGKRKRDRYSLDELRGGIGRLFELYEQYRHIEEKDRTTVQQQVVLLASKRQHADDACCRTWTSRGSRSTPRAPRSPSCSKAATR